MWGIGENRPWKPDVRGYFPSQMQRGREPGGRSWTGIKPLGGMGGRGYTGESVSETVARYEELGSSCLGCSRLSVLSLHFARQMLFGNKFRGYAGWFIFQRYVNTY
jgi:hypothetical protein